MLLTANEKNIKLFKIPLTSCTQLKNNKHPNYFSQGTNFIKLLNFL